MSFVPEFAPDAKSQWRELDIELQELVLDEMERIAVNPPPSSTSLVYHDLIHEDRHVKHFIFLRSMIDRERGRVTVIGIAHVSRAKGP